MHANASHKHTWDSEFPNFSPALPGEKLPTCMDCPRRSPSLIFTKSCQIHKLRNTSTQITSTVPTACKGSFHKPPSTPKDGKQWGKKVKFETPGLQHSVGLNWRQAAWPGVLAGQLSNAPRPSIHFMSRFFHAGLGGQWKSTNADILAGFPLCIDFQLSFWSAWSCKAFMDLVCKLSPWLIDAAMSCSGSIGLGIHVLPFIHVDLSHWPSGWIHSNKLVVEGQTGYCSCGMFRTGINRFSTGDN